MSAFVYPVEPHVRRHGPQGYADAESYRPWLRDDFAFRCVFCLFREQWWRTQGTFAIDHFEAVSLHPHKHYTYDDLLNSCTSCNLVKGSRKVPDPLSVLLNVYVRISEDGVVHADSPEAAHLVELLALDSPQMTELRMTWIGIIALAERHDPELYRRLMGFPDDLPDLAQLRPPGGNSRPEGVASSWFVQRQEGALPETY